MKSATSSLSVDDILAEVNRKYGFVPNVLREMSTSPAALQVYLSGQDALSKGSLTTQEQHAVQLTVATHNSCEYCQAVHEWIGKQSGIAPADLQAIRTGTTPKSPEVALIVEATRAILERRGWLDEKELKRFEQHGVSRARLYEIIAFIGLKTLSNYVNHIAHTPIDSAFHA